MQLINIICNELLDHFTRSRCQKPLIITGQDDVPTNTQNSLQIKRQDMKTTHEEADVIIPQQVQKAMNDGCRNVKVICDDTDVFILLLYYYQKMNWQNYVLLASLDESRKLISIKGTAEKHRASFFLLPAMRVLSGCDTVPKMCGIGKVTALKIITHNPLSFLSNLQSTTSDVIQKAKQFVARCYGVKNCTKLTVR